MAEFHILGQILSVHNFRDTHSLFCPNWTLISGSSEGQTLAGQPNQENIVYWSHPIDIHYVAKGIQGWPKLIFQVSCLDSLSRTWVVGYGSCVVPAAPGHHSIRVACWAPAPTTLTDKLRQTFLGGSHNVANIDVISFGSDRFKLTTQSKGDIELSLDIILRNFSQFGVEYK
ncbi:B9 domain-containing protein 2 isoform X2 [Aricia agestis]|uniref:B9 domain-containing protein 2 isoform X2 n=1 Tax=Aricia agestis TaxID=91739 RepID=UPI001C206594|nr:B9 domain-containing protein 2 isoform X2 [Aricia agestis]